MANDIKGQAARGVLWSFIERFSSQGVQFVITVIMARILSPDDYGLIGMLAIFMSLSQVFIDGGFSSALIQKKEHEDCDFQTVFYVNLFISMVVYLFLWIIAPFIADFYNQPLLCSLTRVYSLTLVLNSVVAINQTILVIRVDFRTQSKISLLAATVSGLIGIAAAYYNFGVWALVVQAIAASFLRIVLSFVYVKWKPSLCFSKDSFVRLFSFGSKLLVAQIITSIYSNVYNLAIGKKYSSAEVGYYSRADQFGQLSGSNISSILSRVSFPVLSKVQDDNEILLRSYDKFIQLAAFIMFPIVMCICGVAKPLIILLLTEKWAYVIPLLQILIFAYIFNGIVSINLNLLYVKGRSDLVLKLEIIKKSIAFTILIISLFFNLEVICLGQVLYSLIGLYINTYYTKVLLNYGFFKQLKVIMPYLLLSSSILIISLFFSSIITSSLLSLVMSLSIGGMVYLGGAYLLNLYAFREGLLMLKNIINK